MVEEENGFWVNINELGGVMLDDCGMVEKGGGLMEEKSSSEGMGFKVLGEVFRV